METVTCYIALHIILFFPTICTGRKISRKIAGGQEADEDEYPYVVRLDHQVTITGTLKTEIVFFQICTCTVLHTIWTLTAAHCLGLKSFKARGNITREPVIRYGAVGMLAWATSEVRAVIIHPAFRKNIATSSLANDIGLVRTSPISLGRYGRISGLDFATLIGHEVIIVGYGDTVSTHGLIDDASSLGMSLQMTKVIIVPCNKEKMDMTPAVCVARRCSKSSGVCLGDSGGPMIHASGIVGLNSMWTRSMRTLCSLKANSSNYDVAVITPISPFIDWISDTVYESVYSKRMKSFEEYNIMKMYKRRNK
ncbi:hypothetical protein B5X24_HaOG214918 [Helicoverpa armigera]|nr:hypothetical protein B5X24_HaOG214918 [Helicoverpa armigera]